MQSRQNTLRKRPRARLRFSLRTVLLLTVVLSVWLAHQTNRVRRQVAAVKAIHDLRGEIRYDYEPSQEERQAQVANARIRGLPPPNFTNEADGPKWLRQLVGDDYFRSVVEVRLEVRQKVRYVDEPMLEHLSSLPDLEVVDLGTSEILDSDLRRIGDITSLRRLSFSGYHISDAGMAHLHSLHQLDRLNVDNNRKVTPAAVVRLQEHLPACAVCLGKPYWSDEPDKWWPAKSSE